MSRRTRFFSRRGVLAGLFAMLAFAFVGAPLTTAQAKPLDAPRAAGTIGERYDGYVVLRDASAPASIKNLVAQTNAQRKALYEKRAKEDKVPVAAIGKIYAEQIMKSAPKGTYFLNASGKWTRR